MSKETTETVLGYMREFANSEYHPASGWNRDQYRASQETTKHWLDKLQNAATPTTAPGDEI
jgi:hypothetical protein